MASKKYRDKYSDCPLCACEAFPAGYIVERLKTDYWPNPWFQPDFEGMQRDLEDQFGLEVSEAQIAEHWDTHVSITLEGYREWAREKTKHSPAGDPYEMGSMNDE